MVAPHDGSGSNQSGVTLIDCGAIWPSTLNLWAILCNVIAVVVGRRLSSSREYLNAIRCYTIYAVIRYVVYAVHRIHCIGYSGTTCDTEKTIHTVERSFKFDRTENAVSDRTGVQPQGKRRPRQASSRSLDWTRQCQ